MDYDEILEYLVKVYFGEETEDAKRVAGYLSQVKFPATYYSEFTENDVAWMIDAIVKMDMEVKKVSPQFGVEAPGIDLAGVQDIVTDTIQKKEEFAKEQYEKRIIGVHDIQTGQQRKEYEDAIKLLEASDIEKGYRHEEQRRAEAEAVKARSWGDYLGQMPTQTEVTGGVVSGLRGQVSPAGQRYFEQQLPYTYQEKGMPEQRQKWWEGWQSVPETSLAGFIKSQEQFKGEPFKEQVVGSDPWQQFLKGKNFLEEFKGLTPRERGYYSGRLRPRTRVLR